MDYLALVEPQHIFLNTSSDDIWKPYDMVFRTVNTENAVKSDTVNAVFVGYCVNASYSKLVATDGKIICPVAGTETAGANSVVYVLPDDTLTFVSTGAKPVGYAITKHKDLWVVQITPSAFALV
jgi:hypothetical protein